MKKSKASVEQTEHDDVLAKASQELEASIADDQETEQQEETEKDLGKAIVKAIKDTAAPFLAKAQTSTLSAEKDRRGSLTESGKDPAASPKKSGKGYEDSSVYEARKGEDMDDDGDDDEDDAPKKKAKKKFDFSKMKKMKKSVEVEEEDDSSDEDEEMLDATEVVAELHDNVESISKSVDRLEEGMAVFGELLAEQADPRRDVLLANLAKAVTHIITEQKEIKKSLSGVNDLMKAVSSMPGVPKIAGVQMVVNKNDLNKSEGESETDGVMSSEDKNRLFQAAVQGKISTTEMKKAIQTNDLTILQKIK